MGECSTVSMGECSTQCSLSLPSGSGVKRSHSSSDESGDESPPTKALKSDKSKICKLIDFPERLTDPGSETEYSFQEEETDLCCRSSTETSSSEFSDRNVEYDIRSANEAPNPFGDSSTASDASVNKPQVGIPTLLQEERCSDSSRGGSSEDNFFDPEIPRRDYWTCLQCSNVNNRPAFRYCEKCYKVRRDLFQPRVKPRKRRKRKSTKVVTSEKKANINSGKLPKSDSGIACSQTTIKSGPPTGEDSDNSLSPDSGADAGDFHGIKLARTKDSVQAACSLSLDRMFSNNTFTSGMPHQITSLTIDEVDSVERPASRAIDEVDSVGRPASRAVDEVDSVGRPGSRAVDEVDSVGRPGSRAVDEVDSVGRPASRAVDEVDSVGRPASRAVDEVDSVGRPASRAVDEVDSVGRPASRAVDEVDSVGRPASQAVDEVDSVRPHRVPFFNASTCDGIRKHSVRTQTDLSFFSMSSLPKEKPAIDIDKCMTCETRSLDGLFVHSSYAHMCCCYKCTVRVWKTTKRCPLCNCRVTNVLRLFKGV